MCPVTRFRSADYLEFLRGLGKFRQKDVTSYTFFLPCRLSWVFDGTWKVSTKSCDQLHGFNAVESNLSFWWDLEKFSQKSVPSRTVLRCRDYLKFLRGLGKFRQKGVTSYTFFRSADYLKFFHGTWKSSTKSCDQLHLFGSTDYLKFLMGLGKIFTKKCAQLHVFAVQTISSFWLDLEKFRQKGATSHTFFSQCRLS